MDEISHVEWSPDSNFILCALFKRSLVEIWSVKDSKFSCRIEQGAAGVSYALFAPDSKHVLVCSDFNLRITIWNILKQNAPVAHIKNPAHASRGLDFSKSENGKYMAIAERKDCKDYIAIVVTDTWELVRVRFFIVTKLD